MSVNDVFQQQAADMIAKQLTQGTVYIRKTLFDCYYDREIFLFQLFSCTNCSEICMLQQILYSNGTKDAYIYFDAQRHDWATETVQHLLDIVFNIISTQNVAL